MRRRRPYPPAGACGLVAVERRAELDLADKRLRLVRLVAGSASASTQPAASSKLYDELDLFPRGRHRHELREGRAGCPGGEKGGGGEQGDPACGVFHGVSRESMTRGRREVPDSAHQPERGHGLEPAAGARGEHLFRDAADEADPGPARGPERGARKERRRCSRGRIPRISPRRPTTRSATPAARAVQRHGHELHRRRASEREEGASGRDARLVPRDRSATRPRGRPPARGRRLRRVVSRREEVHLLFDGFAAVERAEPARPSRDAREVLDESVGAELDHVRRPSASAVSNPKGSAASRTKRSMRSAGTRAARFRARSRRGGGGGQRPSAAPRPRARRPPRAPRRAGSSRDAARARSPPRPQRPLEAAERRREEPEGSCRAPRAHRHRAPGSRRFRGAGNCGRSAARRPQESPGRKKRTPPAELEVAALAPASVETRIDGPSGRRNSATSTSPRSGVSSSWKCATRLRVADSSRALSHCDMTRTKTVLADPSSRPRGVLPGEQGDAGRPRRHVRSAGEALRRGCRSTPTGAGRGAAARRCRRAGWPLVQGGRARARARRGTPPRSGLRQEAKEAVFVDSSGVAERSTCPRVTRARDRHRSGLPAPVRRSKPAAEAAFTGENRHSP